MENGGWLVIPYTVLVVRQALTPVESNVSLQLFDYREILIQLSSRSRKT